MSKTVLLVDDDQLIREGLARVLEDKGLKVIQAQNGEEGLRKALEESIDLVVTDIIMPKADGLSMLEQLRKDSKGAKIPAIILSNDDRVEALNEALQSGVTTYLSKTILNADRIAEQIITALGES